MARSLGLRSGRGSSIFVAGGIALLSLVAAGCTQEAPTKPQPVAPKPPRTANELLEQMIEAYHQADTYQDSGKLVVRYSHNGEIVSKTNEFSLAIAGPNRIRMRAYDALVVCDGRTFRATIDEAPGEVLSVAAPEELTPPAVYKHQALGSALNQIVGSVPLSLFLDPTPLPALTINSQPPKLDSPEKIGDHDCYRVRIEKREGPFVLWIDEKTLALRRVEYPADGYRKLLEPYIGDITDMTITAELEDARLGAPIDDAVFEFEPPSGSDLVDQFDVVRLGARIPKFKLRALDGRLITRDGLKDKIVVIKFWQEADVFRYHKDLYDFEQVQKRYQENDSIVFLAVTADLDDVSDRDLQNAFDKAELSLPIARVGRQMAFRAFGLQIIPTTMLLDRNSKLQELVVGVYPNESKTLPEKLDTLLAGGAIALEAAEKPPEYLFYSGFSWQNAEKPDAQAQAAAAATPATPGIAPRSKPERLEMKRLWSCTDLRRPGNLLAVRNGEADDKAADDKAADDKAASDKAASDKGASDKGASDKGASDKIFVVEALPSVVEISADGKATAKHALDLPEADDAGVAFLRTAVDGAGNRYFLGSKTGAQQVHLFDAAWKRVLSYPESGKHPGVSDALLSDLNGDGELEIGVGYLQAVGVHCVALDGRRLWWNRSAENVLGLDATGPDLRGQRQLLVAQGFLLPIDAAGRERPPISLSDAYIRLIFTADLDGDATTEWCAIALKWLGPGKPAANLAVGLSPRGEELWRYELPAGIHQHAALKMVASGNLLGSESGQWVVAAPDGSIHFLGIDGALIDRFNYGVAPAGMAIARLGGRSVLLISTDEAVEAWQFDLPEDKAAEKDEKAAEK